MSSFFIELLLVVVILILSSINNKLDRVPVAAESAAIGETKETR
jgi:hypothetical protein